MQEATVKNLVQHCSGFWSSPQLRLVVEDGAMLAMDTDFFVQEFSALLAPSVLPSRPASPDQEYNQHSPVAGMVRDRGEGLVGGGNNSGGVRSRSRSRSIRRSCSRSSDSEGGCDRYPRQETWRDQEPDRLGKTGTGWAPGDASMLRCALRAFMQSATWAVLCDRLLHSLPDAALLEFATDLLFDASSPRLGAAAKLTMGCVRWHTLDDLMLAAALGFRGAQLWRLIAEDEDAMEVWMHIFSHLSLKG